MRQFFTDYGFFLVPIVYIVVGKALDIHARSFLKPSFEDPHRANIFDASKFEPEGQPARRRVVLYWRLGAAAMVLWGMAECLR